MENMKTSKLKKYLSILALGVAGGSIYLIPYIRYVFYTWQTDAMMLTNEQLGFLTTMYTIGNILLYIPGGIASDRFSTKKCILFSLMSTTVLTFLFSLKVDSYALALVVWFLFAFTTTFLFWCALMKSIRMIGDEHEQGFLFGLYYMGNGLTGAAVNALALSFTSEAASATSNFTMGVYAYGFATLIGFILVFLFVKDAKGVQTEESEKFKMGEVVDLLKNPSVWVFSLIVFTGYAIYSSASYFTPYMTDVIGISPSESGYLSIIRQFIFYILSPVSGIIADKLFKSTSKWFMILYFILAGLFLGVMMIPPTASKGFVSFYSLLPGLFGLALYGIVFSIANEAKIPVKVMGTAVGIASIIGYAPDFFMPAMFGKWIDTAIAENNLAAGYDKIFIFLAMCSVVGLLASVFIHRKAKKA